MGNNRSLKMFAVLLLGFLALLSVYLGIQKAFISPLGGVDFQWDSARLLLDHQNPYQLVLQNPSPTVGAKPIPLVSHYFPSCLVFLWPYAAFSWPVAKNAWTVSNLLFTFFIVLAIFKLYLKNRPPLLCLIVTCLLLMGPWRMLMGLGQLALFSLCFLLWSILYAPKNQWISGIFLAVSFLKYTLIVPLLIYFAIKKSYRPLVIAIGIHISLYLFISYWVGENPIAFLGQVLAGTSATPDRGLDHELTYLGFIDVFSLFKNHEIIQIPLLLSLTLFFITGWLCLTRKANELLVLSTIGMTALSIFYHMSYDSVVLIFSLVLLVKYWRNMDRFLRILLTASLGLVWYLNRPIFDFFSTILFSKASDVAYYIFEYGVKIIWYATLLYSLFLIARSTDFKEDGVRTIRERSA